MTDLATIGFRADTSQLTMARNELYNTAAAGGALDRQASKTEKALGLVGSAIAALGVGASAREVIKYADSWTQLESQLRQVTSSQEELAITQQKIVNLAKQTRTDLAATGGLYASLARNTEELKLSQDQLLSVTGTMNKLFLVQGTSAETAAGALYQLNQGLSSGALRGDEFNSVAEGAPRVLDALSMSLGIAKGDLRDFAATGGITAQILVKALQDYESTADRLAKNVKATFAQNLDTAKTNITEFVGQSQLLTSSVDTLGSALVSLSENIESTTYAIGAAGAVFAASSIPAMAKYTAATLSAGIANITAARQVTGMSAALGVQSARLGVSAIAANAAGAAFRFMLGPVGLVVTALGAAAIAFDISKTSMQEASEEADKHANKMSRLHKVYEGMTKQQLGGAYIEAQKRSIELDQQRAGILAQLETAQEKERQSNQRNGDSRSRATNQYTKQVKSLKSQLADLDTQSKENAENLSLMNKVFEKGVTEGVKWETQTNKNAKGNSKSAKSALSAAESFDRQIASLEEQRLQLTMTTNAFEEYQQVQIAKASGITNQAMIDQIKESVKALQDQRKAVADVESQLDNLFDDKQIFGSSSDDLSALDEIENKIKSIGGAWSSTGSIIVDTFGTISDSILDYGKKLESIGEIQKKIDEEKIKSGGKSERLSKLEIDLAQEREKEEIRSYRSIAGAAAGMFKEKTVAARAFGAINQALSIAEIALSYQKITAGASATAAHVAQEGVKQNANALTAITSSFAAPFPINFAAGAAMIAIMAGLIGFSGGGGGGYTALPDAGTGTVLGDSSAQSESISNSSSFFNDIQADQLSELKKINNNIANMEKGVVGITKSIISGVNLDESGYYGSIASSGNFVSEFFEKFSISVLGGPILSGLFGSTKKKLVDSGIRIMSQSFADIIGSGEIEAELFYTIEKTKKKLFGLSKKVSYNTETESLSSEIERQIGGVFVNIADSISGAASNLGLATESEIQSVFDSLTVSMPDISLKDKTGEEIQRELEAAFSAQADTISSKLIPSIAEYQKIGEGAYETLLRVTAEQAVFNNGLSVIGNALNLTGESAVNAAQGIIDSVGGIEKFSEFTDSFLSNFAGFGDKWSAAYKPIYEAFSQLDSSIPKTREEFAELIKGIDLTTDAGRELYATLINLAPNFDDWFSLEEQQSQEWFDLKVRLLRAEGKEEEALAMIRERTIEQTRDGLKWMTEEVMKAEELAKQREEAARIEAKQKDLQIQLLELQGKSEEALALSRQKQLEALEPALHATMEMIFAEQDLAQARQNEKARLDELYSTLTSNLNFAESQVESARNSELERISLLESKAQDKFNAEVSAIEEAGRMQERIYSNQKSALQEQLSLVSSIAGKYGADSLGVSVAQALSAARQGDFSPAQNIVTGGNFSSAVDMRIGQAREAFALAEIGKLADQEQSSLERQMSAIDRQISAITSGSDAQIAMLQKQLDEDLKAYQDQKDALNKQVDELLGIDRSVISLEEATALYQKAQQDLLELDYENQIKALEQSQFQSEVQQQQYALQQEQEQTARDQLNELKSIGGWIVEFINMPPKYEIPIIPPEKTTGADIEMLNELKAMRSEMQNNLRQVAESTTSTAISTRRLEQIEGAKSGVSL